jgi:hypothetical protein
LSAVQDSRYWSYVGDRADEAAGTRRAIRDFLEGQADSKASDLGICIDWHDDPPILCVVDRGRGMRPVYPAPEPMSEGGRGLLLVRALAGEVVVDACSESGSGTRVVVALPVQRRDAGRAA